MIRLKLFVGFLLSLFSLIFTSIAFAGGGGVYANVLNSEDSHYNTVRVYFDPALFDCKGMVVSFNFESPVDGDRISGSNGDNSSTIPDNATYENVNGQQYLRCSTYAKVYSPKLEINRHLNISFKGNNLEGSRTIAVSFGSKSYGENLSLLPWEESSNYNNPAPTAVAQPVPVFSGSDKKVDLPPKPTPSSMPTTSKVESDSKTTPNPTPEVIIADNSEELTKKIASLEAQLQQSKKEQSALEQRFNYLVNFLKSIFPFFK